MEQTNMERPDPEQTEAQPQVKKLPGKKRKKLVFAYYVRIILTVLLAFVGTYYTLPQRGLISTLPVYFAAILIMVLIRVPIWQKAFIFGVFAFTFTTVYYETVYALAFAGICVLTIILCSAAFNLLKKKKLVSSIISVLLICLCALPHPLLFGNYPEAVQANKKIQEYVAKHYTGEGIVVSGTSYDFLTGSYKATVYDQKAPTEKYSISVYNSRLTDSFVRFSEIKLMEKRALEITSALREQFPNDRFSVVPLEISGYPFEDQISLSDPNNYDENMRFEIHVPGFIYKEEFAKKAEAYYNTLLKAKLPFREVVFIGGGDYLNAMSISVPYDLLRKDMAKLIKPSHLLPLQSNYVFENGV